MEEKLFTILEKFDKKLDKLDKIENEMSQQNERIKDLEKAVREITVKNDRNQSSKTDDEMVRNKQCRNENFINQMRADIESIDDNESYKKGARSKVKKAASFQERPTQRSLKRRRSTHTVPSDKDEERRLNSFRRECLSKAIQWNIVDLLKAIPDHQIINMPKWLSQSEIRSIKQGIDQKSQFRNFLCNLIEKDFVTMQEWLKGCQLDKEVIQKVWVTFEEFSDIETNRFRMKCFHCKLIENVNVSDVVDHLFSAEIISRQMCMRISSSELIVGTQEGLWNDVLEECRRYIYPQALVSAFKIAITEKLSTISAANSHDSLLDVIDEVDAKDILDCHCHERCSKSLHPLSCLKSMSLAGVYFSPPTVRKNALSSSSDSPESSLSSINSVDEEFKEESEQPAGDLSSHDDETSLKKPEIPPRVPLRGKIQDRSLRKTLAKVPNRSQRALQRPSKQTDMVRYEDSSSDSFDWDCKPPVIPPRQRSKTVNNMSSNRQENKPTVIRANNVYLDSGPKYFQIKKERNEKSSSSGSSSEL